VSIVLPGRLLERYAPYADELQGFLIVARAGLEGGPDGAEPPIAVRVSRTARKKCERCWTYRDDVGADGLCARCIAALAGRGPAL